MPDSTHPEFDFDGQDHAEVFDEENITPDGRDIASSDMQRDVYDMTSFDEDLDEPRSFARDDTDLIADDDARPADYEPEGLADDDLEALGYDGDDAVDTELDAALDESLAQTFPASDPVSFTRRSA
jgi:hypothetical protein